MSRSTATARTTLVAAFVLMIAGAGAATGPATPGRLHGPTACVAGNPLRPTADLFATDNTATITDPADPRLSDQLTLFELTVNATAVSELALPVGSELLDGVFWSSDSNATTYERSREFHLACTDTNNLFAVADDIRVRYHQESVLSFEFLPAGDPRANAVTVSARGIDRTRFHDALASDPLVRDHLGGGSITRDGTLILVVDRADLPLTQSLIERLGGDWDPAGFRYGDREFVGSTNGAVFNPALNRASR
ncbi:hypothetical protein [Nocardia sp. NBC_00511]|uniref:hypothetical protein n=1 Tax=Nocardia sp. NBC_00511 TaxID=2903591 RepID=UPI0030E054AD